MSTGYKFTSKLALDTAIGSWIADQASATTTYGDISTWDVSAIKNFRYLFSGCRNFNSDISNWDVSNVTNFSGMFKDNQDIGDWDEYDAA